MIPSYRDASISSLPARVHGGAFAGLRTTVEKRDLIRDLRLDLADVDASCRILFLDFPAGHLLTKALADTTTAWKESHEELLRLYRRRGFPDVAVIAGPPSAASDDSLLDALRTRPYRLAPARGAYEIYRRHDRSRCGSGTP